VPAPVPTAGRRYGARHVPRCPCDREPRQAGRDHGHERPGRHVPRPRRPGQPGVAPVPQPRPETGRPRGVLPGEPPAVLRPRLGRPLRGPLLHGHELAAHHGRDGVHNLRLRGPGLRHFRLQAGPGGGAGRPRGGCRALHAGRHHRRLRLLGGRAGRPAHHPAGGGAGGGPGHALLLRHDREAQGRRVPAAGRSAGDVRPVVPAEHGPVRRHGRQGVPVPRASMPPRRWSSSSGTA
jgi:hypothetical protein